MRTAQYYVVSAMVFGTIAPNIPAQPRSAIEFYDSTGASPTARLGWQGAPALGKLYVEVPPGTRALNIQDSNLTVGGDVVARAFHGDGSFLTGVQGIRDSAVTSGMIRNGTIKDEDISPQANISGTKIRAYFGTQSVVLKSPKEDVNPVHVLAAINYYNPPADLEAFEIIAQKTGRPLQYILAHDLSKRCTHFSHRVYVDTLDAKVYLTNGAPGTPSDSLLKRNVRPLSGSLAAVCGMTPVAFEYRAEDYPQLHLPAGPQIGLIAQDIEQVAPEVVSTDADGYKHVDYPKLVPLLVRAMKEQQDMIENLSVSVGRLLREIDSLRASMK